MSELTIAQGLIFYLNEHVRPLGQSVRRVEQMVNKVGELFGMETAIDSLVRQDFRRFAEWRFGQKVSGPTVRRELTIFQAMVNHNYCEPREPRCRALAKGDCPKPGAGQPRRRFLTIEEWNHVIAGVDPVKEARLWKYFQLAIHTGARARAIEELTRARVDLVNRMIDYNVPGRRITNKRRAVLPINDELFPMIEKWCEGLAPNDPIIGYGPSGKLTSTHHLAKRAMKRAGIDEFGVCRHWCRKSFASWRLQAGHSVGKVAAAIGDKETTVERSYGFILPEHLRATVNL